MAAHKRISPVVDPAAGSPWPGYAVTRNDAQTGNNDGMRL
jgi:hypothetical protein